MSDKRDELHVQVKTHIGGLALAAAGLIRKMDKPGMSIELLRASSEAGIFRRYCKDLNAWFYASLIALPDEDFTPEEKRLVKYLFAEKERV